MINKDDFFINFFNEEKNFKIDILEKNLNYNITIKKNDNNIIFIYNLSKNNNKNYIKYDIKQKKINLIKIFQNINIFFKKMNFLFYFFYYKKIILKKNIFKNNFIIFLNNLLININYSNELFILIIKKNIFYIKNLILLNFFNEIYNLLKNKNVFFINNNFFFFFEKKLKIFNKNNYDFKKIPLKYKFNYILLNFKKKKIFIFLKKTLFVVYSICNKLFLKEIGKKTFLKLKIYIKFGKNFTIFSKLEFIKMNFLLKFKTIINYCLLNKIILIKKFNNLNKENYIKLDI